MSKQATSRIKSAQSALKKKQRKRGEFYAKRYAEILGSYPDDQPKWREQALFWLLSYGLRALRANLESKRSKRITWKSPFLNLDYPVECNWKRSPGQNSLTTSFHTGTLTPENTRTKKIATTTLAQFLVKDVTVAALRNYTNFVSFQKTGTKLRRVIPLEVEEWVAETKKGAERKRLIASLYEPFSIGAAPISFDVDLLKPNKNIPKKLADELSTLQERIHLPAIQWNINVNGHAFTLSLIFLIHPFEFDIAKRHGNFPLTIGLVFHPNDPAPTEEALEQITDSWMNPGTWSKRNRTALWNDLFSGLKKDSAEIAPPPSKELEEAIVAVNAQIRISVDRSDPAATQAKMDKILKGFKKSGELMHMDYSIDDGLPRTIHPVKQNTLAKSLKFVNEATTPEKKSHALEALVADLFTSVPDLRITQRALTQTEEIDLLLINDNTKGWLARQDQIILVECKNWSSKCGKNDFVIFKEKILNRKRKCSLGFLISWNGFADTIAQEALRGSREEAVIALLDGASLHRAVENGSFLKELESAWQKAISL